MIELDDPIWSELRHPYGAATEVPNQLKRIENAKNLSERFWEDFGNTLCHQSSIGSASVAALPHLVRIAADHPGTHKACEALHLAALILCCVITDENEIPTMKSRLKTENPAFIAQLEETLSVPLKKAVHQGREVLGAMIFQKRQSFTETMAFLAMVAAFDLRPDVFAVLRELRYERFDCPHCEEEVSVHSLYSY
jgi:hypothetical protein